MYNFKFSIGEKVTIKINRQTTGTVTSRKFEHIEHENGSVTIIRNYYVKVSSYLKNWYKEEELLGTLELQPGTEEFINSLMVDVNLMEGTYYLIEHWNKNK